MDLSIVIVNWNSAAYLDKCLRSIYENTAGLAFETIVVDNASFDGSHGVVRGKFPQVKYVQSFENLGFARANNLGFGHSTGRTLLFLNPDTEILGGAIRVLWRGLDTLPEAGAVNSRMLNTDRSLQPECIHNFPTIFNEICDVNARRIFSRGKRGAMQEARAFGEFQVREVPAIAGACVMIRREIFEKIGRWSTEYFMYSEDLDLCWKLRRAGYRIYQIENAEIVHHGGRSSEKQEDEFRSFLLLRESTFRFLKKFRGRAYALIYKGCMAPTALFRLVLLAAGGPAACVLGRRRGLRVAFKKWMKILGWSLGWEEVADTRNGNRPGGRIQPVGP